MAGARLRIWDNKDRAAMRMLDFVTKNRQKQGLAKLKQNVMRQVQARGETKISNTLSLTGSTIAAASTDPSSQLITFVTQGGAINQREGNQCSLKKLIVSAAVNASITPSVCRVRFILFIDRQPVIGTPVTYSALFASVGGGNEFFAHVNPNNRPRFKILYDKQWKWDPFVNQAATTQGQMTRRIVKRFKGNGMKLRYTDGTSTNVLRNHIYMLVVGDLTANQPTIRLESQLWFKDPQ